MGTNEKRQKDSMSPQPKPQIIKESQSPQPKPQPSQRNTPKKEK